MRYLQPIDTQQLPICNWATGNHSLKFDVFSLNVDWNEVSGLYIFTKRNPFPQEGRPWIPIYIGQASSFKDRFTNHEHWDGALKLGMTNVHATVMADQGHRDLYERILIREHQPLLNQQLK